MSLVSNKLMVFTLSGMLALSSVAIAGGSGDHQHMDHSKMGHQMNGHHMQKGMMHDHSNHGMNACGSPGNADEVTKTIKLDTVDAMQFDFKQHPDIKSGDVVRFIVTNKGLINHEFSIGNAEEQKAHQAMMRKMPNMVHEDGNSITVKPGETRELIWKFHGDRNVVFACNIPGHAEAGMVHEITVQDQ
jgi:uncharacterized cupredoxin-like copper-binding protein